MIRTSLFLFLGLVFSPLTVQAATPPPVHLVVVVSDSLPTNRQETLDRSLSRTVGERWRTVPADVSRTRLIRDKALRERRRSAAGMAARAGEMVEQMRYEEALRLLGDAEHAAREGLARVVQPELLADICLQRGLALLPTRAEEARRHLVQSFLHWPARPSGGDRYAPKILQELRRAAEQAQRAPTPEVPHDEAARLASTLGAARVLLVIPRRRHQQEGATLMLYEVGKQGWSWSIEATWASGAGERSIDGALSARLPSGDRIIKGPEDDSSAADDRLTKGRSDGAARPSRWLVWTALGTSGAALVAGTVLAVLARDREREAESYAGQTPLVTFEPTVQELEASGRRLQRGAIALFAVGAAAGVAAGVLWLVWPGGEADDGPRVGLTPGGVQVTLRFH